MGTKTHMNDETIKCQHRNETNINIYDTEMQRNKIITYQPMFEN